MNLYKLHTNPEQLTGGENYKPIVAMELLTRFNDAESDYLSSPLKKDLIKLFKKGFPRNQRVENYILQNELFDLIIPYAQKVLRGRWKEAENLIIQTEQDYYGVDYAINILKKRWKRLEKSDMRIGATQDYEDHFEIEL